MKKTQITTMAGFIFYAIWFVFAIIMYISGIYIFKISGGFGGWLGWGFVCCAPMIGEVIKTTAEEAKKGARKGATEYTVTVSGNRAYVENHPFRGFIIGLIAAVFINLLAGPIVLPLKMLTVLITAISFIVSYSTAKKNTDSGATKK